ncbi:hypothetical protein ES703_117234 [subsurface metagenome]
MIESVKNRLFAPISRPGGIEVGVCAIGEFPKARAIRVDHADRRFPVDHFRGEPRHPEENELAAGLRP